MSLNHVGPVGFGLMRFTTAPTKKFTQDEFNAALKYVLDNRGYSEPLFLNGGEFYGIPERHENINKIGAFFREYPQYADQIYLSVKGGLSQKPGHWLPDTSTENLNITLEAIKQALQPLYAARKKLPATLDMFTLARVGDRPIEDSVKDLKKLQDEGYFSELCLSEVSGATIEKAAKIAKIGAIEVEFSLFVPEAATNGVFAAAKKLNIPAVCYSPLGMGFLTDNAEKLVDETGTAFNLDRFKEENWDHNKKFLESVQAIAKKQNLSPTKLSVSYITSLSGKGDYPHLIPIPGSTDAKRQLDNISVIELSPEVIKNINQAIAGFERKGGRYNSIADSLNWG